MEMVQPFPTRAKIARAWLEHAHSFDLCVTLHYLRTFAPKSSYGEIFFISRLELVHKVLTPKNEKKIGGHRLCFGEIGSGKMP